MSYVNKSKLNSQWANNFFYISFYLGFVVVSIFLVFNRNVFGFFWSHSTFFQTIGFMGIIGLVVCLYFYVVSDKIIIKRATKTTFGIFSLLAMIGLGLCAMIDIDNFILVPIDGSYHVFNTN